MPQVGFSPEPHTEAIALIRGKPVVTREVFDGLLPELRARAFVITGVEGAHVLQRVRDAIAALPEGGAAGTWDKVKGEVADALEPHLGDQAERRAELLVRTHGFQAFQASNWRVAQEDADTTHLQYLATEDERVRDSHLALNGLVLPKNDPFWEKHFPPWDWGCRCRTRPMNPDLVDLERESDGERNPDDQLVLEGPALERLRQGKLERGGKTYEVGAPSDGAQGDEAYRFDPGSLSLSLDEIAARYDPEMGAEFLRFARNARVAPGVTLEEALSQPGQQVTRRQGAIVPQESLRGELPLGPKDATAFGRERADQIRRMEKEAAKPAGAAVPAPAPPAKPWAPQPFTGAEIGARRQLIEPRPKTYQEFLDEVPQVAFGRPVTEEYRRAVADLNFWEYNATWDLGAERALQSDSGGNKDAEALARWSNARRSDIEAEAKRRRAALPTLPPPPEPPAPPAAPPPELLAAESKARAAGWSTEATNVVRNLPASLAKDMASADYGLTKSSNGAHYEFSGKKIVTHKNPQDWSGHRTCIEHEIGHHIHNVRGLIKVGSVDSGFAAALSADAAAWDKFAQKSIGPDWKRQCDRRKRATADAMNDHAARLYGVAKYSEATLDVQKTAASFADTVLALTGGRAGSGHSAKYMAAGNHAAMEAFANCFSAALRKDPLFQTHFKSIMGYLSKNLGV